MNLTTEFNAASYALHSFSTSKTFYTKWQWEDSSETPASNHQIYSPTEVILPLDFRSPNLTEMFPDLEISEAAALLGYPGFRGTIGRTTLSF